MAQKTKSKKLNRAMEIGGKSLTKFQSDVAYYLSKKYKFSESQAFKYADSSIVTKGFTGGRTPEFVASTVAHKHYRHATSSSSAYSAKSSSKRKSSWENECLATARKLGLARNEREGFFICLAAKNRGMSVEEMVQEAMNELPSTQRGPHARGPVMPSTKREGRSGMPSTRRHVKPGSLSARRTLVNVDYCENCGKSAKKLRLVKDRAGSLMKCGSECARKFKKTGLLDRIAYKSSTVEFNKRSFLKYSIEVKSSLMNFGVDDWESYYIVRDYEKHLLDSYNKGDGSDAELVADSIYKNLKIRCNRLFPR